jgi:hypothetical protein
MLSVSTIEMISSFLGESLCQNNQRLLDLIYQNVFHPSLNIGLIGSFKIEI